MGFFVFLHVQHYFEKEVCLNGLQPYLYRKNR